MVTTFRIEKTPRGYLLIQKTDGKDVKLSTSKTMQKAKLEMKLAKQLVAPIRRALK